MQGCDVVLADRVTTMLWTVSACTRGDNCRCVERVMAAPPPVEMQRYKES